MTEALVRRTNGASYSVESIGGCLSNSGLGLEKGALGVDATSIFYSLAKDL